MSFEFTKYHGLGNDFILIDNRHQDWPVLKPSQAAAMCDRHWGVGADGVIFALPGRDGCDYAMRIFNSDGSEPEMCGNGIRCLALFLAALEGDASHSTYRVATLAGAITPQLMGEGKVKVDMDKPQLSAVNIPTTLGNPELKVIDQPLSVGETTWTVTCASMGNPHCVTFVDSLEAIDLAFWGPQFEQHPAFPQRTNTEFIEVVRPNYLKMRVWERGAGMTLACGTGACAAVVAGVLSQRCQAKSTVELPGGCLEIEWSTQDQHVYMTGPAERVFSGTYFLA